MTKIKEIKPAKSQNHKKEVINMSFEETTGLVTEQINKSIDIKLPDDILQNLKIKDEDPLFVIAEIVREGKSLNDNIYTPEFINDLAEQIDTKKPYGYLGHLKDEDRSTARPEPQTIWLKSMIGEVDNTMVLYAKGYILPKAEYLRDEIEITNLLNKQIPVSIYGTAERVYNEELDGYEIRNFELESIDWARDQYQGVKTALVVNVTKEMKTEEQTEKSKTEEALTKEIMEYIDQNIERTTKKILQEFTEQYEEIFKKLDESITTVQEKKQQLKEKYSELKNRIRELEQQVEKYKASEILEQKVKTKKAFIVLKELVYSKIEMGKKADEAVAEVLASESGKMIIKEMSFSLPSSYLDLPEEISNNNFINIK